eukprot:2658133-Prymnesium_polylepis.2
MKVWTARATSLCPRCAHGSVTILEVGPVSRWVRRRRGCASWRTGGELCVATIAALDSPETPHMLPTATSRRVRIFAWRAQEERAAIAPNREWVKTDRARTGTAVREEKHERQQARTAQQEAFMQRQEQRRDEAAQQKVRGSAATFVRGGAAGAVVCAVVCAARAAVPRSAALRSAAYPACVPRDVQRLTKHGSLPVDTVSERSPPRPPPLAARRCQCA